MPSNACNSDDDCPSGKVCQNGCCRTGTPSGTICDLISSSDMTQYVRDCRAEGASCDRDRGYAFDTINFSGLTFNQREDSNNTFSSTNVYCCQNNKNCVDGITGCEPSCTACCSVDDCDSTTIRVSLENILVCIDDVCARYDVIIPQLFSGGNYSRIPDGGWPDFSTGPITCSALKALRTDTYSAGANSCQRQSGKVDSDFPCMLRLVTPVISSGSCPDPCGW